VLFSNPLQYQYAQMRSSISLLPLSSRHMIFSSDHKQLRNASRLDFAASGHEHHCFRWEKWVVSRIESASVRDRLSRPLESFLPDRQCEAKDTQTLLICCLSSAKYSDQKVEWSISGTILRFAVFAIWPHSSSIYHPRITCFSHWDLELVDWETTSHSS
jgi:hypothetical protein